MDEQQLPMEDDLDNIIVMTDDEGNDKEFEFLDVVEYNNREYAILLPVADDDGMVVIFRIEEDADNEDEALYIGVDDEAEAEAVFQLFKEQAADEFDFID